jgi:hypothetical protein
MGRRKKNATVAQDIKSFTETKEDSLTEFSKEKISLLDQETIDQFEVKPVSSPSKLGGQRIEYFVGKSTYKQALTLAYEWQDRYNNDSHNNGKIRFVNYYPQSFVGRTILIGYDITGITE